MFPFHLFKCRNFEKDLVHTEEKAKFALAFEKVRHSGCSAVRLAHLLWEQGVEGSNPFTPTLGRISLEIRPFFFR